MGSKLRERLSFANVVSVLALFVALGGSSYAAVKISGKQIKSNSITTKQIKNKSLLKVDFKPGQLPAGAKGAPGATNVTVRVNAASIPTGGCTSYAAGYYTCTGAGTLKAACAAGERATGGGVKGGTGASTNENRPDPESGTPTGWVGTAQAAASGTGPTPTGAGPSVPYSVYVVCAAP